jgi:hypothetical protein
MKKLILILCLLLPMTAIASENKIEKAIMYIINKGFPKLQVFPRKNHPLKKDIQRRKELIEAIENAHQKYPEVPEMLLVAKAFREGSFVGDKDGAIGEKTTFQMLPVTAKAAKKLEPECTLKTYKGAALCTAAWLNHWKNKCGTLEGALVIYATGHTCKIQTRRVQWIVHDRIRIMKALEKITSDK